MNRKQIVAILVLLGVVAFIVLLVQLTANKIRHENQRLRGAFDRVMVGKTQQEKDDLWTLLDSQKARLVVTTDGKVTAGP